MNRAQTEGAERTVARNFGTGRGGQVRVGVSARRGGRSFLLALSFAAICSMPVRAYAQDPTPSRPALDRCAWERLSSQEVGIAAWVQRCDLGYRQTHFEFLGNALAMKSSYGGAPDLVVHVFDILPGETPEAAMRRIFKDKADDRGISRRCVLKRFTGHTAPAGVRRYVFSPNAAYRRELKADPIDEVPPPPCGDWGEDPDGIQYFEVHTSAANKLLFVRVGQDAPLFDEQTLRILPVR